MRRHTFTDFNDLWLDVSICRCQLAALQPRGMLMYVSDLMHAFQTKLKAKTHQHIERGAQLFVQNMYAHTDTHSVSYTQKRLSSNKSYSNSHFSKS